MRDPRPLLDDPGAVVELTDAERAALRVKVAALAAALDACPATIVGPAVPSDDRLLTVRQVAERLQVTPRWLYRRAKQLPFARILGPRVIRFSERGLDRYMKERRDCTH